MYSLYLLQRVSADLHGRHQIVVEIHKEESFSQNNFIFMNIYDYVMMAVQVGRRHFVVNTGSSESRCALGLRCVDLVVNTAHFRLTN
jgi:hypothetical protein